MAYLREKRTDILEGAAPSAPRLTGKGGGGGAPPSRAWLTGKGGGGGADRTPPYSPEKGAVAIRDTRHVISFAALLESGAHGGDEFLVVERFHEEGERADGFGGGVRGQVFARSNNNYAGLR